MILSGQVVDLFLFKIFQCEIVLDDKVNKQKETLYNHVLLVISLYM